MKRSRFSEEQTIWVLKEAEGFENHRAACARRNVTEQTCFCWRKKFGGMDVAKARNRKSSSGEIRNWSGGWPSRRWTSGC
jgi:putative transposase